jgi:transposase, IS6 family
LSPRRDAQAAKRFFAKALAAPHSSTPRVITVDKNAAYPKAFKELKAERIMPDSCELRQYKYLNNLIEQDHRFIKRLVKLGMGFFSFETASRTLQGYEAMKMLRKGQMHGVEKGDRMKQVAFIASLFEVAV